METERGSMSPWLDALTSICTAFISASLMLVPGVKGQQSSTKDKLLFASYSIKYNSHTSNRFDVLDVLLGICYLDRGAGDQVLVPAAYVVVKVDDAQVIVYGHVVQNGLHGLHRLREKFGN